ncbi:MAG: glutathione S-transferase [Alphaproteobacteria bacterium]|nr:glutathione S-transferase [Alphaproteobacteria bacterium]
MLTLYHSPQSRSSRIIWLLEEAGADYKIEYVTIPRQDGSGAPDPKNPHPEKKVPFLVNSNGDAVFESAAICLYVADLYPQAGLAPRPDEKGRGEYVSWLFYYAGVIEPVVHFVFFDLGDHEGLRRTFRGRAEMDARILGALEAHDYIAGDKFTAADFLITGLGQFARQMLPADPIVDAYLKRCSERPALARALKKDARPA